MPLEKTFVIFKPDSSGLEDVIMEEILSLGDIKIINTKHVLTNDHLIRAHYLHGNQGVFHYGEKYISHHKELEENPNNVKKFGEIVISNLCKYMGNKILFTAVFQGEDVVNKIRQKVGPTEPFSAPSFTIRGKYGKDSYELADKQSRNILNLIHCSDCEQEALREIYLWLYSGRGIVIPNSETITKALKQYYST